MQEDFKDYLKNELKALITYFCNIEEQLFDDSNKSMLLTKSILETKGKNLNQSHFHEINRLNNKFPYLNIDSIKTQVMIKEVLLISKNFGITFDDFSEKEKAIMDKIFDSPEVEFLFEKTEKGFDIKNKMILDKIEEKSTEKLDEKKLKQRYNALLSQWDQFQKRKAEYEKDQNKKFN